MFPSFFPCQIRPRYNTSPGPCSTKPSVFYEHFQNVNTMFSSETPELRKAGIFLIRDGFRHGTVFW